MATSLFPLQYLIAVLALWLNRQQQDAIDYLTEENRMLKAKLGGRKIQFTDAERRRLAIRAKALGRKLLSQIDTLVAPDTLAPTISRSKLELRPSTCCWPTPDQGRNGSAYLADG